LSAGVPSRLDPKKFSDFRGSSLGEVSFFFLILTQKIKEFLSDNLPKLLEESKLTVKDKTDHQKPTFHCDLQIEYLIL